ncbi:MAG TPA: carboxypeptidase M32 [Bacillota bacterium]
MNERFEQLLARCREVADLERAAAVLAWDEQTYMPPGGARARADQKATLRRLAHAALTSPEFGELLQALAEDVESLAPDSDQAALVRLARRHYDRAVKLPPDLVEALSRAGSEGFTAWLEARRANDFAVFQPKLERLVELQRQKADALGWRERRYDALLDLFEPGMRTSMVEQTFSTLRDQLVPFLQAIRERVDAVDDSVLRRHYPAQAQWEFTVDLLRAIGFDFDRGRQDRSEHPFTTSFSVDDVRVTTRIHENYLAQAVFSTIHEAGHAFYELGLPREHERTPLCETASLGLHESQSRLWENVIGRSRGFWEHFLPRLAERFPSQLAGVGVDQFYRAVNRVEPSFIRTEADEVTYNLHIFLRFELEQALLDGDLKVADLPGAWNGKMQAYLGVTPPDMLRGVLQDVHWSDDLFGYFPTYSLGTVLAVQFYEKALADHPGLPEEIRQGRFDTLHRWLTDNVHRHGARYEPAQLIRRVTGTDLDAGPYLRYIRAKYGEIYGL